MNIISIDWQAAIAVRHKVLWPNKDPSFCAVDGDRDGLHYGVIENEELVCVASIYFNGDTARLRKFATLPEYQGNGIGSAMLEHLLSILTGKGISCFWCDARESAIEFYAKFGMQPEGDKFYKSDVAYFKMSRSLS